MKRSKTIQLVLLGTCALAISSCDDKKNVSFKDEKECLQHHTAEECKKAMEESKKQYAEKAPKFMSKEECEKRALEALKLVGLKEKYYKSSPFELSGGQKRRVAIAGVLAMRPKVLVLDEPTAGLDPKGRDDILDQIAYLHKQSDMTVILVSHSMEDIARYADRIIVMNKGSVMYNGAPKEVFAHYQELEKIGLAAPQVTYIMHDLKEKGLPVKVNVTTVEEAADEIMQALEKKI